MSKLFNKERLRFVDGDITWEEATRQGVDLLVKGGYATEKLADAIFESTKQHGAYYVLERGIALLHAPPGDYSIKAGTSVLMLKENIQFNNEDRWAKVIVTLSAPDSINHIEYIQEFGECFTNKEIKEKIMKATNEQELFDAIK